MNVNPLAFDALLQEYLRVDRIARSGDTSLDWSAEAARLRWELDHSRLSIPARTLIEAAIQGIRLATTLPQLDDALAYIDVIRTSPRPERPTRTGTPTEASPTVIRHPSDRSIEILGIAEVYLRERQHRHLERARHAHRTQLSRHLGLEITERFSLAVAQRRLRANLARPSTMRTYEINSRITAVRYARRRVERAFSHGLVYGVTPNALLEITGPGRIGTIAGDARSALTRYWSARIDANRSTLNFRTGRLVDIASAVTPDPATRNR